MHAALAVRANHHVTRDGRLLTKPSAAARRLVTLLVPSAARILAALALVTLLFPALDGRLHLTPTSAYKTSWEGRGMAETAAGHDQSVDLLMCSPDGESRGLLARAGDLLPLDPTGHLLKGSFAAATAVRPWGLRYLRVPRPRAGKHEGPTSDTTGGDQKPGSSEETKKD